MQPILPFASFGDDHLDRQLDRVESELDLLIGRSDSTCSGIVLAHIRRRHTAVGNDQLRLLPKLCIVRLLPEILHR
ncbi:hypothetical protein BTZ20_4458 [Rhodococcus sp. MTM3W5.2]|nr:hypothetical protein BTZ20_4458 [Rhodococcus sp. MTM3W5.2]